ncbi:MAG: hypothetical protein ABGZ49_12995 [Akkermansiaceae bacterium]
MRTIAHSALLGLMILIVSLASSSCGPPWEVEKRGGYSGGVLTRLYGPPPESYWNKMQLWYRVGDEPATYLPKGYPAQAPRTELVGLWVVDKRDDKRFFIPNKGVKGFSRAALLGEAKGITNWEKQAKHPYFRL